MSALMLSCKVANIFLLSRPASHNDCVRIRMRTETFEWFDLRYFLAVARTGTLTGAAKQLDIEHFTVKRRITALENAFAIDSANLPHSDAAPE